MKITPKQADEIIENISDYQALTCTGAEKPRVYRGLELMLAPIGVEVVPVGSKPNKEMWLVMNRMVARGGAFEVCLANTWCAADEDNRQRIENEWPELIQKFKWWSRW
jgi:hypothetical protein